MRFLKSHIPVFGALHILREANIILDAGEGTSLLLAYAIDVAEKDAARGSLPRLPGMFTEPDG